MHSEQKVFKDFFSFANATKLTVSSVYRHQQAITRRNQHPESLWWETPVGSQWLKILVLGVVYFFGIKYGIGALGTLRIL